MRKEKSVHITQSNLHRTAGEKENAIQKVARMPAGWNDTGAFALTEKSMKKYIELIGNWLPDDICWCEDDTLIAPVDFDAEALFIWSAIDVTYCDLI